jgi:hypothetical protein
MPTQFCEFSAYVQVSDTAARLSAITAQLDAERVSGGPDAGADRWLQLAATHGHAEAQTIIDHRASSPTDG